MTAFLSIIGGALTPPHPWVPSSGCPCGLQGSTGPTQAHGSILSNPPTSFVRSGQRKQGVDGRKAAWSRLDLEERQTSLQQWALALQATAARQAALQSRLQQRVQQVPTPVILISTQSVPACLPACLPA